MKQEVILVLDCGATNVRAIEIHRVNKHHLSVRYCSRLKE